MMLVDYFSYQCVFTVLSQKVLKKSGKSNGGHLKSYLVLSRCICYYVNFSIIFLIDILR